MKKIIFSLMFLMTLGMIAEAQPGPNKQQKLEKLREFRKKMLIEKLSLTEQEQKDFLPVYEEYKVKENDLKIAFRKKYPKNKIVYMTDEEANVYLDDFIKLREDQVALFKTYADKFRKVLPIKKVIMIQQVEKEIQMAILKKAKEMKTDPPADTE